MFGAFCSNKAYGKNENLRTPQVVVPCRKQVYCVAVGDCGLRKHVFQVEVKRSEISILLPEPQKETELLVNAAPPTAPLPQSSHELPDCVRPARKTQLPDSK